MAKNNLRIPRPVISLAMQNMLMRQRFPSFVFDWKQGTGRWKGTLQPREISPMYEVLIEYKLSFIPEVWIISPALRSDAPHRYSDHSLCLYWPDEWKWSPDKVISTTIVPWAATWLYFYESLLDTGEWLAQGARYGILPNNVGEIDEKSD